jgi:hypothetical protein
MADEIKAVAKAAMDRAIEFCAEKTGLKSRNDVLKARRAGRCEVCGYLRYALGKEVAAYLGAMDDRAKAIYIFPDELDSPGFFVEDCPERPNMTPGIRMLVRVSRKSPALSDLIDGLAEAVGDESRRLGCPTGNVMCHHLEALVVDDDEVEKRTGFGVLLDSVYMRPIEIWHR